MAEYIKKHYRLMLLSAAAALVCFGYQAFNGFIRIDTEELVNHPGSTLGWLTIGRFGLVLLKQLLGLTVHHTVQSGALMLLFFVLGANLLTWGCWYFSGKDERYPYWMFLLIYITSNIWSFQFYFSLQQAEVALAMLLLAVAAFLMCRVCLEKGERRMRMPFQVSSAAVSAVFLVTALGAYQAMAVYYIAVCAVFFLLYFRQQAKAERKWLGGVLALALHFAASYVIYTVIANTWFMAAGDYMEGQSNWGTEPLIECVKNILRVVKNQLLTVGPRNFSFYVFGIAVAACAVILAWKKKLFRTKGQFALYVLAFCLLLASPFLMTVYSGAMLVTRTQFALPVAAAFLAMLGGRLLAEAGVRRKRLAQRSFCVLVAAVLLVQLCYNLRLHAADRARYEHDAVLAEQVAEALLAECGGEIPEQPVIFIGYRKPELGWWNRRSEMYGWSFFEWDYSVEHPAGATHRIAGFLQAVSDGSVALSDSYTEEMEREAAVRSQDMPVFPADGSVLVSEDYIVVKLSEITERTDIDWW